MSLRSQRGSALAVAIFMVAILSLMGLAFILLGDSENLISVSDRNRMQANYVAEGVARLVKGWFDDPSTVTGYLVPVPLETDRSLRWVDPDGDGTYQDYTSASAPWNVVYRSGTDDLFEKPYRGSPALSLEGTRDHPDLRISASGSTAERSFLTTITDTLFPDYPSPDLRARVNQIDVFAPPVLQVAGQRVRYGIATIRIEVGIVAAARSAFPRQVAERVVEVVLNEAPYAGPKGPLTSCRSLVANGDFNIHWGDVAVSNDADLSPGIDVKLNSGTPWFSIDSHWQPDNNGDGTADDIDTDGTPDFLEWMNDPDNSIEDPWLRFVIGGVFDGAPSGIGYGLDDGTTNNQPWNFSPGWTTTVTTDPDKEHSNFFLHSDRDLCTVMDYDLWKGVALAGGRNVHYYAWDAAAGLFREGGSGTTVTFESATNGGTGYFFFDTTDGLAPHDDDSDGFADNLTPDVTVNGGWWTGGFIYLNAGHFTSNGLGNVPARAMRAPGEPWMDANGNGTLDSNEWFMDLGYPASYVGPGRDFNKLRWTTPATAPAGVVRDTLGPVSMEKIHLFGVLYTSGQWNSKGNGIYYGAVVAAEGVAEDTSAAAGTPEIFFDERLITGGWPPPELHLPRTIFTSWQTDL